MTHPIEIFFGQTLRSGAPDAGHQFRDDFFLLRLGYANPERQANEPCGKIIREAHAAMAATKFATRGGGIERNVVEDSMDAVLFHVR